MVLARWTWPRRRTKPRPRAAARRARACLLCQITSCASHCLQGPPDAVRLRILSGLSLAELLGPLGVNSRLRAAAVAVLLSRTGETYRTRVRSPYTSDLRGERERAVATLFAVGLAHADRRRSESELLEDEADWRDVFELLQPRARLEDLILARRDVDEATISFGVRRVTLLVRGRAYSETHRSLGDTLEAIAGRLLA